MHVHLSAASALTVSTGTFSQAAYRVTFHEMTSALFAWEKLFYSFYQVEEKIALLFVRCV